MLDASFLAGPSSSSKWPLGVPLLGFALCHFCSTSSMLLSTTVKLKVFPSSFEKLLKEKFPAQIHVPATISKHA
jgi:hypothetical protein